MQDTLISQMRSHATVRFSTVTALRKTSASSSRFLFTDCSDNRATAHPRPVSDIIFPFGKTIQFTTICTASQTMTCDPLAPRKRRELRLQPDSSEWFLCITTTSECGDEELLSIHSECFNLATSKTSARTVISMSNQVEPRADFSRKNWKPIVLALFTVCLILILATMTLDLWAVSILKVGRFLQHSIANAHPQTVPITCCQTGILQNPIAQVFARENWHLSKLDRVSLSFRRETRNIF